MKPMAWMRRTLCTATLVGLLAFAPRADAAPDPVKDPVGYVMATMIQPVMTKISGLISAPIESAKATMNATVAQWKDKLKDTFKENVVQPALEWAITEALSDGSALAKSGVGRFIGDAYAITRQIDNFAEAALAFGEDSMGRIDNAIAGYEKTYEKVKNFSVKELLTTILPDLREKAEQYLKGKAVTLFDKAWSKIESGLGVGKTAAVSAMGSIPIIGGTIAGVIDAIFAAAISELRSRAFEYITTEGTALMTHAFNTLQNAVDVGAAKLDNWLKPLHGAIVGIMDKAKALVKPLLDAYDKFKTTFAKAKEWFKKNSFGAMKRKVAGVIEANLGPMVDLMKKPFDNARAVVSSGLDAAEAGVVQLFQNELLQKSVAKAADMYFDLNATYGSAIRVVDDVTIELVGRPEQVEAMDEVGMLALRGGQLRDKGLLADAEAKLQARSDFLAGITDAQIAAALIERTRDRIVQVTQSEALKAMGPVFSKLEAALKPKRDEGKKLIKEVPHVGVWLQGLADTPVQDRIRTLVKQGLASLGDAGEAAIKGLAETLVNAAIGAAPVPPALAGHLAKCKQVIAKIKARAAEEKAPVDKLLAEVKAARASIQ